ncbi:MAG: lysylphosphatidylglycerol synthase transmembrane domain-containing protein [Candidatus Omnitrophota bacterium]
MFQKTGGAEIISPINIGQKSRAFFSFLLRIGLSSLLLFYLFKKIDLQKTVEVLKTSDLRYLFFAGMTYFTINFILLLRWLVFIRALALKVTLRNVLRYFFAGLFGNLFLPSSVGGDVIKVLGLCHDSTEKPKVVASVVIDRLSGFAGIVVVAVASFSLGYRMIDDKSLAVSIVVITLFSAMLAGVLFNEKIYSLCCQTFNRMPRIKRNLMQVHYDLALLKDKRWALFNAIWLSCVAQLISAFVFFLTARALHQDIELVYFCIFVPLICVVSFAPSIGGLGVREAGAAYLFSKIGVDSGIAVSISLINFSFMVAVGLIGGAIYVVTLSPRRIQHHQSAAGLGR